MKIGFLGAGRMASKIVPTLQALPEAECYAVACRSQEKADAFAKTHGFARSYASYEALVADPQVELIYIATPNASHYDHMRLCLEHGKPVLCEKSFTLNAAQAEKIRGLAAEKGVFVAEALWTRYMPSRDLINEILNRGIIGTPYSMTANLSYPVSYKSRVMDPAQGGGALLDVGVYGLNFALMHFGDQIKRVESSVQLTETGVDGMETVTIFYEDGRMAVLTHGIYARSDRRGIIHGDRGYLVVDNINNPQSVAVYDASDRLLETHAVPQQISGYEYEFLECIRCIAEGKTQAPSMPLGESVKLMSLMDTLRRQWGLVYPQEREAENLA